MATKTVTTICAERGKYGYPDPLIYTVDVPRDAEADQIIEAVIQCRIDEVGEEFEDKIRDQLCVFFGWEGDLDYRDMVFDHRT